MSWKSLWCVHREFSYQPPGERTLKNGPKLPKLSNIQSHNFFETQCSDAVTDMTCAGDRRLFSYSVSSAEMPHDQFLVSMCNTSLSANFRCHLVKCYTGWAQSLHPLNYLHSVSVLHIMHISCRHNKLLVVCKITPYNIWWIFTIWWYIVRKIMLLPKPEWWPVRDTVQIAANIDTVADLVCQ